jgi:heme/copper-type cytochrome/quinol oxidase subunit 4
MGRIRIKKKGRVLPFRQTVAYRFIFVALAVIVFVIAVFQVFSALVAGNTVLLVIASGVAAASAFLGLHNFTRMQTARIPRQTLQRMKRR